MKPRPSGVPLRVLALALMLALVTVVGCYPSNVIEETDRAVRLRADEAGWGPVDPAHFAGAYASERIEGDAAGSLVEVRYVFHPDGTYTGAGLVLGEEKLHYQTLDGSWEFEEGRLILDGARPGVDIEQAGERLRLAAEYGVVVLRRFELN